MTEGPPSPSVEEAWEALEAQLDWAQEAWFGWVFTDHPPSAHVLRRRLKAWLTAREQRLLVLKPESPEDADVLLSELLSTDNEGGGCVWVEMLRWDLSLPGAEPNAWREAWTQLMLRGNERRERLLRHLGGGLVFVAPMERKAVVRDAAPDLWSMRSLVVEVVGAPKPGVLPADLCFLDAQPIEVTENQALELEVARQQAEIARRQVEKARERGDVEGELLALAIEVDHQRAQGARADALRGLRRMRSLLRAGNRLFSGARVHVLLELAHELMGVDEHTEALEAIDEALVLAADRGGRVKELGTNTEEDRGQSLRADLRSARARALTGVGRREEALTEARRVVEEHRALVARGSAEARHAYGEALRALGAQLHMSGDLRGAISATEEALDQLLQVSSNSPTHLRRIAGASLSLAYVREANGDAEAALQTLELGLARTTALSVLGWFERFSHGLLLSHRARLLSRLGRVEEGQASARAAVDLIWPSFEQAPFSHQKWIDRALASAQLAFGDTPPDWLKERLTAYTALTGTPPPTKP